MSEPEVRDLHERPAELLQRLLRFDTTNPPGSERGCVEWLAGLFEQAGLETAFVAAVPTRPSLVARLRGRGDAPPLLLEGHVDVVSTAGQRWTHPPFAGEIVDGYVWGRGALDMKGGVAMFVAAALRAAATQLTPAGDVVLALVSDEEAGATPAPLTSSASARTCSRACDTPSASSAASRWSSVAGASIRSRLPRSSSAGCARPCGDRPGMERCRCAAGRWRAWPRSCAYSTAAG
jgi:hypothetical protein